MGTTRGQQVHQLRQIAHLHVSSSSRSQDKRSAIMEGLSDMTASTTEMNVQDNVIPFPTSVRVLSALEGPSDADLAEIESEPVDFDDEDYWDSLVEIDPHLYEDRYNGFGEDDDDYL